jgi:hypothetical protein
LTDPFSQQLTDAARGDREAVEANAVSVCDRDARMVGFNRLIG